MLKRIAAITFIFFCTAVAWMMLGGSLVSRTEQQDRKLRHAVNQLWGSPQTQVSPEIYYREQKEKKIKRIEKKIEITEVSQVEETISVSPEKTDIAVDIKLQHRKKGLLWYPTYQNSFNASYTILNNTDNSRIFYIMYTFPNQKAIYDNFQIHKDGKELLNIEPENGHITIPVDLQKNQTSEVNISYNTQGIENWWYKLGDTVKKVKYFRLVITTDFDSIDFPDNTISPTVKSKSDTGWKLEWSFKNLISDIQIGITMPEKMNPGPFVSRITFFAPVSLFLFFFLIFIITTVKKVPLHPMNYFFISGGFFSFHLLMAYLVDHVGLISSFSICSVVSLFLVVSYMKLVTGSRFALLETGISQFVFMILFNASFFFKGITGLSIAVMCIITLFLVMQITGNVDWDELF